MPCGLPVYVSVYFKKSISHTVFLIEISIQQVLKKKRPDSEIRSRNYSIEEFFKDFFDGFNDLTFC
jgi:hypothetical protein